MVVLSVAMATHREESRQVPIDEITVIEKSNRPLKNKGTKIINDS